MTDPINPTTTEAWAALSHHRRAFHASLRDLFHDDPQRADHMTYQVADLTVDLSKHLATTDTMSLLVDLANSTGVVQPALRTDLTSASPSRCGIIRSTIITSKSSSSARRKPSRPSRDSCTP